MGDEPPPPELLASHVRKVFGDRIERDLDSGALTARYRDEVLTPLLEKTAAAPRLDGPKPGALTDKGKSAAAFDAAREKPATGAGEPPDQKPAKDKGFRL